MPTPESVPAMAHIIEALTKPLSAEEQAPKRKEKGTPSRIVFKGQLEEFDRFFYKRGWGDGLPLRPPTEAAVREMLAGTDLPPEHVVGEIVPRHGKATVEKIAVNAVMAGALPTHMPILIACVEALADPRAHLGAYGTSTGSWMPFWIINGPVRNDARVNCGSGAMSPGDIANAAIGRTMGLIVKNVGGARKAIEDMGVYGNPGKYSCVAGENEEMSPWEPLHVEQGFARDESAVTLFFPNCYSQIWQYGSDDKGILATLIYNLPPGRSGLTCLLMTPTQAKTLAQKGWTKPMIRKYVYEYGRVPAYRHPSFYDGGGWTGRKSGDRSAECHGCGRDRAQPGSHQDSGIGRTGCVHGPRVRGRPARRAVRDQESQLAIGLEQAGREVQEPRPGIREILGANFIFLEQLDRAGAPRVY